MKVCPPSDVVKNGPRQRSSMRVLSSSRNALKLVKSSWCSEIAMPRWPNKYTKRYGKTANPAHKIKFVRYNILIIRLQFLVKLMSDFQVIYVVFDLICPVITVLATGAQIAAALVPPDTIQVAHPAFSTEGTAISATTWCMMYAHRSVSMAPMIRSRLRPMA